MLSAPMKILDRMSVVIAVFPRSDVRATLALVLVLSLISVVGFVASDGKQTK